jgi:RNA polymerase sigma-70 factor (ECF subfamily)
MSEGQDKHEDEKLLRKAQDGDTEAAGQLFEKYRADMIRFACRYVPRETAEDIVQEVFADLSENDYEGLRSFRGECSLRTFLLRLTHHKCVDYLRKRRLEPLPDDDDRSSESDGTDAFEQADRRMILEAALANLSVKERRDIRYHYFGELSFREISERTRERQRTIENRMYRALQKLRKILPEDFF